MTSIPIAEAKARFSSVIKQVRAGDEVIITSGQRKEPVAVLVPFPDWKKSKPRVPNTLKGKVDLVFSDEWEMTDDELLRS